MEGERDKAVIRPSILLSLRLCLSQLLTSCNHCVVVHPFFYLSVSVSLWQTFKLPPGPDRNRGAYRPRLQDRPKFAPDLH
jgi:hypothetical protein